VLFVNKQVMQPLQEIATVPALENTSSYTLTGEADSLHGLDLLEQNCIII